MAAKHKGCVIGKFKRRPGHLYYVTAGGMLVEKKMKHAKGAKSSCSSGKSMGLRATGRKTKSRPKRRSRGGGATGFAAMSHVEVVKIARKGGKAAHRKATRRTKKTAHRRKKKIGFAAMSKAKLRKIAAKGGRKAHHGRRRTTRRTTRRRSSRR